MKQRSKLYRNLKPGDKFAIADNTSGKLRSAVITVSSVHETKRAWFTGRRLWQVHGNYPWWWPFPITAYSDERVELIMCHDKREK